MRAWIYGILGIFLIATYYLIQWVFNLSIVIILVYVLYRFYDWYMRIHTPKGKRIKHKLLKSYLNQKYGREGGNIYRDMVKEMKKNGYR